MCLLGLLLQGHEPSPEVFFFPDPTRPFCAITLRVAASTNELGGDRNSETTAIPGKQQHAEVSVSWLCSRAWSMALRALGQEP